MNIPSQDIIIANILTGLLSIFLLGLSLMAYELEDYKKDVGVFLILLGLGLFLTINGLVMRKVYTTGITKNSK